MKKIGKIWGIFMDGLIILILIGIMGIYVLQCVGIKPYTVVSGSMEPEIATGSICFIDTNVKYGDIHDDDVIAYQLKNGNVVTHRVIHITDKGFETKGDNNDVSDGITTNASNYVGKNIWSIPYLGYIFRSLQTVRGKILCVTVCIAMIVVNMLISASGEMGKEEGKLQKKRARTTSAERARKI